MDSLDLGDLPSLQIVYLNVEAENSGESSLKAHHTWGGCIRKGSRDHHTHYIHQRLQGPIASQQIFG